MSREEKLFSAIGGVPDSLVNEAADPGEPEKKRPSWGRWGALAAALILVVGVVRYFPRMGGGAGGSGISNDSAAPSEVTFMHYAGPVLPPTVVDGPEGLPATREVTWSFPFTVDTEVYSIHTAKVTDTTVINNDRGEDLTVTIGYPVTATLRDGEEKFPTVTVDGKQVEVTLLWGDQKENTEGDYPVWTPRMESWADCKATLEDGSYLKDARQEAPALEQTVTVWEVVEEHAPEVDPRNAAPTLAITFHIDTEKTQVYAYGFNGYEGREDGTRRYSFFVHGNNGEREYKRYLIFLGEAPKEYTMGGYENGACEKVLDGVTGKLRSFTMPLGELLDQLAGEEREEFSRVEELKAGVRKMMERFLPGTPGAEYYFTMEDLIGHALTTTRVVWSTAQVTIPKGESVTITAQYEKEPSYDFACANTKRKGIDGWDLAVRLGSNLDFRRIIARLENTQRLEIVRNDFGFDQRAGILEVELSPDQEHCAMEIRVIQNEEK